MIYNPNNHPHQTIHSNKQLDTNQQSPNLLFQKMNKNSRFMSKFKLNQYELRNKFKNYVIKEKQRFPLAYQYQHSGYFDQINQKEFANIREIRKQRNNYMEELKKSTNQKNYHSHLKQSHQKTFSILQKKMNKVETIRKLHKQSSIKLEISLKQIDRSIRQEKIRSKSIVESSRVNIIKSRKECIRKKFSLADEERQLKQIYHGQISQEKNQIYEEKHHRYHTVKRLSKNVAININKFIEKNQNEAQQIRFQRLFRELAEKQQIRIASHLSKKQSQSQVYELKNQIVILQDKIKDYRQKLGERRYDSSIKFSRLNPKYKNRSFTESREISTKSQFFTGLRYKNHTQQEEENFDY